MHTSSSTLAWMQKRRSILRSENNQNIAKSGENDERQHRQIPQNIAEKHVVAGLLQAFQHSKIIRPLGVELRFELFVCDAALGDQQLCHGVGDREAAYRQFCQHYLVGFIFLRLYVTPAAFTAPSSKPGCGSRHNGRVFVQQSDLPIVAIYLLRNYVQNLLCSTWLTTAYRFSARSLPC